MRRSQGERRLRSVRGRASVAGASKGFKALHTTKRGPTPRLNTPRSPQTDKERPPRKQKSRGRSQTAPSNVRSNRSASISARSRGSVERTVSRLTATFKVRLSRSSEAQEDASAPGNGAVLA